MDLLCFCSALCLVCLCARLFICALWSHAGKGLTSWLSFVVSFLIFAPLLTMTEKILIGMNRIKSNKQYTIGNHSAKYKHSRSRNDRGAHCMSCI